ncbi:hypothetical protein CHGG_04356 [Chaetomium globosum CBS 148.51]|uniref:Uncharacterized protein n=1 Tax=Chaetomium globosum (strain ATCC 6205 / CBS 148.51 / DSM 1962 / NBRC 6347 / NRRL 1970) TaxID=306901 RepID=Q2H1J0_CHAGB|nr:uncharacterized protein CHGG_04356 [Chaetomium globosum CBS 148.51]EAQ87737.1 hypothetical protein CHGG_04356 [Chaetomium globosum CBS 148.51]
MSDQNPIRPEQWAVANDYGNLPGGGSPGGRATLRDTAERRASGSRWFGPNGVFGPARRTLPSTGAQEAGVGGNEITHPTTHDVHRGNEPARAPTLTGQTNPATTPQAINYRAASYPAAGYPVATSYPDVNYLATDYLYRTASYQARSYPAVSNPTASYPTASYLATIPTTIPATIPAAIPGTNLNPAATTTTLTPSRMQQVTTAQLIHAPRAPRRDLHEAGVSGNYRGDINNPRNLSANIPEDHSCSFWLRGLPAGTTVHSLLAAVRGVGRVYCTVIAPANRPHGWPTAAAKLVFFEREAAQRFWGLYGRGVGGGANGGGAGGDGGTTTTTTTTPTPTPTPEPLLVGGQRVVVERNRTRVAEATLPRGYTRVVRVTGLPGAINVGALLAEFQAKFVFEMDEVAVGTEDRITFAGALRLVVVEFRFGSFRCQAQTAHRLLQGRAGLEVQYGRDPCDR